MTDDKLQSTLQSVLDDAPHAHNGGKVLIGIDTRTSSPSLADACKAGVQSMGLQARELGLVTTPELHFCVQTSNHYNRFTFEEISYFTSLMESYRSLTCGCPVPSQPVYVDCANGVGALKLKDMCQQLEALGLPMELRNAGDGRLNHLCGADYVQKELNFPAGNCRCK